MGYIHGTQTEYQRSVDTLPDQVETAAVYIGVAPVHLVRGYRDRDVVNSPVLVTNMEDVKARLGFSENWKLFTLCEAFAAHFDNDIQHMGTLAVINVLDPEKHKKTEQTTRQVIIANRIGVIQTDTIILDTLALADMVEDVDYSVVYDFENQKVILTLLTDSEESKTVNATYSEIDPSQIAEGDIMGVATDEGEYTGIEAVDLVYQELGLMPTILASPGFSQSPAVYKALTRKADKINGHWDAFVNADLPLEDVDSIKKAVAWKLDKADNYGSENSKVWWPKWKANDGRVYHLSTIATWLMQVVDSENGEVPMETPSNKRIFSGKQYFGENSRNKGFDQQKANLLNEKGISTAVYFAGRSILWGPHTAAYEYGKEIDPRVIFDSNVRMLRHISNGFHKDHGLDIDGPMPRSEIDRIKNVEDEKLDILSAMGALIGRPALVFAEADNPAENMVNGDFVWSLEVTVTPPGKSLTLKIAYTTAGFSTLYGGE